MTNLKNLSIIPSISGMEHLPIPIQQAQINNETIRLIDSRDLHEFLQVKSNFSTWIKRKITKYQFIENQDYFCLPKMESKRQGGHNAIFYVLTMDTAKELAMLENNDQGRKARRYFIRCEKELRKQQRDEKTAMLLEQFHRHTAVTEQYIEMSKPKVELYNRIIAKADSMSMTEAANLLGFKGVSANRMYGILRACKILKAKGREHNLPMQKYLDDDCFEVAYATGNKGWCTTMVRPRGLELLRYVLTEAGFKA